MLLAVSIPLDSVASALSRWGHQLYDFVRQALFAMQNLDRPISAPDQPDVPSGSGPK